MKDIKPLVSFRVGESFRLKDGNKMHGGLWDVVAHISNDQQGELLLTVEVSRSREFASASFHVPYTDKAARTITEAVAMMFVANQVTSLLMLHMVLSLAGSEAGESPQSILGANGKTMEFRLPHVAGYFEARKH